MKYIELKSKLEKLFIASGITETADIDWIMVEVLGVRRSMLPLLDEISESDVQKITEIAEKRAKHIPLAYILKKANFYGYDFIVDENVLIPRQDTEVLVENVIIAVCQLQEDGKKAKVLDIGTGSGAISITVALEAGVECYSVDVSEKALEVAMQNAKKLNADVKFIKSDVFENIKDLKVDLIVSNPPYIKTGVIAELEPEVALNEPILALDGGDDGLIFYKKIIAEAKYHLNKNGKLYFEIGYDQAQAVKELMQNDFKDINVVKDYGNNDRVVYGTLKENL